MQVIVQLKPEGMRSQLSKVPGKSFHVEGTAYRDAAVGTWLCSWEHRGGDQISSCKAQEEGSVGSASPLAVLNVCKEQLPTSHPHSSLAQKVTRVRFLQLPSLPSL